MDFSGQLDSFLDAEDRSTSTEEIPQLTPWTSPSLPKAERKVGAQSYLREVLSLADEQKVRQKRVRVNAAEEFPLLFSTNTGQFLDHGASPKKRVKMATRLEELVYQEQQQKEDMLSDGDLIKLQMLALHGLQQEKAELVAHVKRLEEENKRLLEMIQQQSNHRLAVLNDFVKRRGLELKSHGESLVAMAEAEVLVYGSGSS
jgi:hypothetical protein